MTNEQIIAQQVEALEKLLQIKQAIIDELEKRVSKLEADKFNTPNPSWSPIPGWYGQGAPILQPFFQTPSVQPFIGGGSTITISQSCPDGSPHDFSMGQFGSTANCKKCGGVSTCRINANGASSTTSNVYTLNSTAERSSV